MKTVGETNVTYYFTTFLAHHPLEIALAGIALIYLLLRVTRQR